MARGYWIGRVDVSDPAQYAKYVEANGAAFARFGARFLVRGGRFDTVEGESRSRNVVIEFPSFEDALACYRSPEYQAAKTLRESASIADLIVIEGYEP